MEFTFNLALQAVANGLAMGGLYIMMALGLTLLISIMNILQLAHGEIYMVGAYVVYFLTSFYELSLFPAILISMAAMAVFGVIIEKALFKWCVDNFLASIVVSIGLTYILQSFAIGNFGLFERRVPRLAQGSFFIFDVAVPKDRITAMFIALILSGLLYLFLKKTKYGQSMVASAQNPEASRLRGINPALTSAIAMAIACALAAVGGAMGGSIIQLNPYMGFLPMIKGLTIIVIGGMGSLMGAIVGGFILGLIDGLIPVYFGVVTASILPLVIVILVILLKPHGLFGHEQ